MKTWQTKRRAFTLVELLVVIAIIGILFVVLISKVDFATEKSKATGVQTDFRSYQVAIETVARENAGLSVLVDNDADGEAKYAELEKALNKNLDPKLHVEIDADGMISTEAKDPWKEQYLGAYLAPDADGTVKDRGAIVMYSKGSNLKLGTTAATENGIVNVTLESGKETEGADDYSISTIYTYVNGYGEIQTATKGFSNNQNAVVGENVTPSDPSDPSDPDDPDDPDQGGSGATEYVVQLVVNDSAMGSVAFTSDGHSGTSLTLTGTQSVQLTATANAGYKFIGWYVDSEQISPSSVYECSVSGKETFMAVFAIQLVAGLYDANDNLIADWSTLINTYGLDVSKNYTSNATSTSSSPYYVLTSNAELASGVKLVIDDTVPCIGTYAFMKCTMLTEVIIGNGVQSINEEAFLNCSSLKSVEVPTTVISLGASVFRNCSGRQTIIFAPNSFLLTIGDSAFAGCSSLTKISIPTTVTDIGDEKLFYYCTSITSVGPVGSGADVELPPSITTIGKYFFAYCENLRTIEVPANVTTLAEEPFVYASNLTSVKFEDNSRLTTIGERTFRQQDFENINIPSGVTTIGNSAFDSCTKLKIVTFEDGTQLTTIGDSAFSGCTNLESVFFQGTMKQWCALNFANATSNPCCNGVNLYINNELLEGTLVIPDDIDSISNYTFYYCTSLERVEIPASVTTIGNHAFY